MLRVVTSGVTKSSCELLRSMLRNGMEKIHPLAEYAKREGTTLSAIAKKAGLSRMSLHRIIRGEQNATMDTLRAISAVTNGSVPVSVFFEGVSQ